MSDDITYHGKKVITITGTVQWVETYATPEGNKKQSVKIKGLPDIVSTCMYFDNTIKKEDTISVYTLTGNNEYVAVGKFVKGGPENLGKFEPPDEGKPKRYDTRSFRGKITSCNIRMVYGKPRQWLRSTTGQIFVTVKHINREIKPGDCVAFAWFWGGAEESKSIVCSAIKKVNDKDENNKSRAVRNK